MMEIFINVHVQDDDFPSQLTRYPSPDDPVPRRNLGTSRSPTTDQERITVGCRIPFPVQYTDIVMRIAALPFDPPAWSPARSTGSANLCVTSYPSVKRKSLGPFRGAEWRFVRLYICFGSSHAACFLPDDESRWISGSKPGSHKRKSTMGGGCGACYYHHHSVSIRWEHCFSHFPSAAWMPLRFHRTFFLLLSTNCIRPQKVSWV
jgi:hypothetical protein